MLSLPCIRNDKGLCDTVWIDQGVEQNCALTSVHTNGILSLALVVAVGWCLH